MTAENEKRDSTPDILFAFVRDMVYHPNQASLDPDSLSPEYRDLGEGLLVLAQMLDEQRCFAEALARGDLHAPLPSRGNELAAPLKSLHASLRHITWQSQQVAMGDYRQKVDFMGEFSESFNEMILQLDARQKALEREIEISRKKTRSLERGNNLFAAITEQIPQAIFVIDSASRRPLFQNESARRAFVRDPALSEGLLDLLRREAEEEQDGQAVEISTRHGGAARYYSIHQYSIHWVDREAVAFIAEDISVDKAHVMELEKRANVDELTQLYLRHYGMAVLNRWVAEKKPFSICFADLDYLKYVNDTFGHSVGDAYIVAAAALLRDFSPDCVACRIGGDEFMVLVPSLDEVQATSRMKELQERFKFMPQNVPAGDQTSRLRPHISFGIVAFPGGETPCDVSRLLALADERMYECKRRSKVVRQS